MTASHDRTRHAAAHDAARDGQRGYALVALLALMTILALALVTAAPNLRQQRRRTLEDEAIARGEEVAEAIRLYVRAKNTLPTSIDQLLEGVPVGTKRVQIMRPWAARDPLSKDGEWVLVKPNDKGLLDFQAALMRYAGNRPVQIDSAVARAAQFRGQVTGLVDLGDEGEESPCEELDSSSGDGPFVGVAVASTRKSVITYYGIDCHSRWIFTPLFR